jgi:hypothetical protein
MYDLTHFSLSQMIACGAALRRLGTGAGSMEEAANRIVQYFHHEFIDPRSGNPVCALIRFYKTHPYGELDPALRAFARSLLGNDPGSPFVKCLTLLATTGDRPEWNARTRSTGHQAIPLPSEQGIAQIPMIAQLVKQFGVEVSALVTPDPTLLMDQEQKTYGVFYVADAVGSPHIPAQDSFVIPCGIRSVIGFGGTLPPGELFATILFSKVSIPHDTADLFKTLSLSVKTAVLPFAGGTIFAEE